MSNRPKSFYRELLDLFGDAEIMMQFMKNFIVSSNTQPDEIPCRHARFRPVGEEPCFSFGGTDGTKAMYICKSTIRNAALQFQHQPKEKRETTTKIRAHHFFKLAACSTKDELLQSITALEEGQGLLHLCGHGICSAKHPRACVNPKHMVWGSQSENIKHTAAHAMLELVESKEEYNFLLFLFQRDEGLCRLF